VCKPYEIWLLPHNAIVIKTSSQRLFDYWSNPVRMRNQRDVVSTTHIHTSLTNIALLCTYYGCREEGEEALRQPHTNQISVAYHRKMQACFCFLFLHVLHAKTAYLTSVCDVGKLVSAVFLSYLYAKTANQIAVCDV